MALYIRAQRLLKFDIRVRRIVFTSPTAVISEATHALFTSPSGSPSAIDTIGSATGEALLELSDSDEDSLLSILALLGIVFRGTSTTGLLVSCFTAGIFFCFPSGHHHRLSAPFFFLYILAVPF